MPTAVPITFPNQQRNTIDHVQPNTISPSPRWPGSPMSYKLVGSLGSRFYPGSSPGPFNGPLDLNDFKVGGIPSSIESEHGRLLRALNGEESLTKDDFTQNYSCCGLELADLHALLEHFEETHVVVVESPSLGPTRYGQTAHSALDPDAMELDTDSGPSSSASSPPSTPPLDTASAFDTSVLRSSSRMSRSTYHTPSHSRQHSPHPDGGRGDAFNHYASYSDFSSLMPGAVPTPHSQSQQAPNSKCIPPALLFSSSTQTTPSGTPAGSRISSPAPHKSSSSKKSSSKDSFSSSSSSGLEASTTLSRPSSTLLIAKPFRCPTVGCNKSYKQANGLKYHITHGQCNFMPRDPSLDGLNDHELDQKARPYVCQVGSCTRRYKNMNGLRYHYQHSGAHGAVGLALLASGQHSLQTGTKDANVDLPLEFQTHTPTSTHSHPSSPHISSSSSSTPSSTLSNPQIPQQTRPHQIPKSQTPPPPSFQQHVLLQQHHTSHSHGHGHSHTHAHAHAKPVIVTAVPTPPVTTGSSREPETFAMQM